jgi:cation-transporting ATPase 13A3/4/5
VESELQFLGLLIMQNNLKPETADVLKTLRSCEIRAIMATGDNALTAISVARKCKLINPTLDCYLGDLANDGRVCWNLIQKN